MMRAPDFRGVADDGVDDLREQSRRNVVAHVVELDELGAGDQLGGAPAARDADQRIDDAVDHQRRHPQLAQGDRRASPRP